MGGCLLHLLWIPHTAHMWQDPDVAGVALAGAHNGAVVGRPPTMRRLSAPTDMHRRPSGSNPTTPNPTSASPSLPSSCESNFGTGDFDLRALIGDTAGENDTRWAAVEERAATLVRGGGGGSGVKRRAPDRARSIMGVVEGEG